MSTTINGLTVRLGRSEDDWRKYVITVQMKSLKQPGLKASNDIDPGVASGTDHLLKMIAAAGAACAEYLGEKYGEPQNPGAASRDALRAFQEECHLLKELAKDLPAKLRRLESHLSTLTSAEVEAVRRFRWLTNQQQQLTQKEVQWINEKLGALHGAQL
jgi:hypothetical protein